VEAAADQTRSAWPAGREAASAGRIFRKCSNGLPSRKKELSLVVSASTTSVASGSEGALRNRPASASSDVNLSRFRMGASRVSSI
jgi:hypothetical protein